MSICLTHVRVTLLDTRLAKHTLFVSPNGSVFLGFDFI